MELVMMTRGASGLDGNKVQVVVDHNLEGFACQAVSFVFIDRLAVDAAFRSVSVCIYSAVGLELFHEFRRELFVELLRYIAERVSQSDLRLRFGQSEASVRSSSDTFLERRHFRVSQIQLDCHCVCDGFVF